MAEKEIDSSVIFRTGLLSMAKKGAITENTTNMTNGSLELTRYFKRDLGFTIGYRLAQDSTTGRSIYQAGFAGVRIFPMSLGTPVRSTREGSLVNYDFMLKPYVEAGGSIGRIFLTVIGTSGIGEFSSEYYGINVGGGSFVRITDRFALDLNATMEQALGFGPINFQSSNLLARMGVLYFF